MPPLTSSTTSSSSPFSRPPLNSGSSSSLQIESAWASFESMLEKRLEEIKPKTAAQIKASGDSRNKTILISAMLAILALIILFAGLLYLINKDGGKEFTNFFMPVITAIITGTLGYLSGDKSSK